jgi:predicted nuclease of predicted toxin-antitoxin system
VKLLFDENLSPRLVTTLADVYPGSQAARERGLRGANDQKIWQYALDNGLAITSKDSDFAERSAKFGSPPKVIWLRVGNCTTARIDFVLRNMVRRIEAFERRGRELPGADVSQIRAHPLKQISLSVLNFAHSSSVRRLSPWRVLLISSPSSPQTP